MLRNLTCFFFPPSLSRFARHARGLRISGWSYGYEYGTAKLHSSPDDPTPYSIKTWTPNPFIFAKSPPSPSHDDARRTPYPPWNDRVSTEPHNVKFCRPQCWWTGYGHSCPIAEGNSREKQTNKQTKTKTILRLLNFDQMLTLNTKFQTAVIIFYFLSFFINNRGPTKQEHKCEIMGSLK